ncbi:MAG: Mth938-like domain-containing protein [Rhodocyclaceae bacterium]|nr:Mth938-like domain-containing protein [Rhodocyclaceae bacterium]MBK6553472.1 Mth938-like domain-containing protein [Rhodocyclaceae bacterium]MBK7814364.1 Mth938-like domain-containing protein [Rhodocyclaceae bacterium]MBK9311251.1 Mth938-like domain-containing protein [Rhodocyclaceae bacterium]
MKLHLTAADGHFTVTGHAPGRIDINGRRHQRSLLIMPDRVDADWGPGPTEALAAEHLADLAVRPGMVAGKVLLLGTGSRQRFPPASWLKPLIDLGIGVEVMDTGAACRTYNVLMAEGRDICAALVVE